MKKIICIGSVSKDIFFPTAEGKVEEGEKNSTMEKKLVLELGAKYHIDNRYESLGGCAANQAVGLSRLGLEVELYSAIGGDLIGQWINEELKKEKVSSEMLQLEKDELSGLSAIVVEARSGERIIFSNQEANEKLSVDASRLVGADFVSATDLSGDWKSVLSQVFDFCVQNKIKVSFNPRGINIKEDPEKVMELAGKAEIFFVNKDEALEICEKLGIAIDISGEAEVDLVKKLQEKGAHVTVVTDGERGAWVGDGNRVIHVEALKENAVDMTGAGDAFASGFLGAYIKGEELSECAKWGIANGGNSVNFYGGTKGLMGEEEIRNKSKLVETKEV